MSSVSPAARRRRGKQRQSTVLQTRPLPPYQPQVAELNPTARDLLMKLCESNNLHQLQNHLNAASAALTDNAGKLYDKVAVAKARHEKRQLQIRREEQSRSGRGRISRLNGETDNRHMNNEEENEEHGANGVDGSGEGADADARQIAEFEKQVEETTSNMEVRMREVVDAEVKLDKLVNILKRIGQDGLDVSASGDTRPSLSQDRRGGKRRRIDGRNSRSADTRMEDDEEDEGGSQEDEDRGGGDGDISDHASPSQSVVSTVEALKSKVTDQMADWERLSLSQRYSTHNSYVGFYRVMHDSKYAGEEVPPLPHRSTWFDHILELSRTKEQGESGIPFANSNSVSQQTGGVAEQQQSDEIAIRSERVSLKCPITLLLFKEPVASTKCPHSFERSAIEDMIRHGAGRGTRGRGRGRGGGAAGAHGQGVRCPVCTVTITQDDLRPDPVLLRRVRRLKEMEDLEEEDEAEDRHYLHAGRVLRRDDSLLIDTPVVDRSQRRNRDIPAVKSERAMTMSRERSVIPDTQYEGANDNAGEEPEDDGNNSSDTSGEDDAGAEEASQTEESE